MYEMYRRRFRYLPVTSTLNQISLVCFFYFILAFKIHLASIRLLKKYTRGIYGFFNRPGVAGAVL